MKQKLIVFFKKYDKYVETFVAAFTSYVAVNVLTLDFTVECAWCALFAGALASAFSVLLSFIRNRKK